MSEIRVAVDLEHPPQRVWRALTDRELLPRWFAASDLEPQAGTEFRLEPENVPGLDGPIEGELLGLDEPRRISMRWHGAELITLVDWELAPIAGGTALTWRESCVGGRWEPERRELLTAGYQELLTVRLPAVLDWVAFGEVDFAAAPAGAAPGRARPARRRGRWLVGAGTVVALGALAVAAGAALPRSEHAESPDAAGGRSVSTPVEPSGTRPSGDASPGPARATPDGATASPSATPTGAPRSPRKDSAGGASPPPVEAATAALSARYATAGTVLFGYTGEVTLANGGEAAATGWTVTVTLPSSTSTVKGVSGAQFQQNGRTVTFTGSAVPAGGTLRFTFEVRGAPAGEKAPAGCTVDGRPCAGP